MQIGSDRTGWEEEVVGEIAEEVRSNNGERLLSICSGQRLKMEAASSNIGGFINVHGRHQMEQ